MSALIPAFALLFIHSRRRRFSGIVAMGECREWAYDEPGDDEPLGLGLLLSLPEDYS